MLRLLRRARPVAAKALVLVVLCIGVARATESSFSLDRYHPAAPGGQWLMAESLTFDGVRAGSLGERLRETATLRVDGEYARDPLILRTQSQLLEHVVSRQPCVVLALGASPAERWMLWASGETVTDAANLMPSPASSPAFGDMGLGALYRLYGTASAPLWLALSARAGCPPARSPRTEAMGLRRRRPPSRRRVTGATGLGLQPPAEDGDPGVRLAQGSPSSATLPCTT